MTGISLDNCCQLLLLHLLLQCTSIINLTWTITLSPSVTDVVRYVNESYIVTCVPFNNNNINSNNIINNNESSVKKPVTWMKGSHIIGDKGHPHVIRMSTGLALVFERVTAEDRGQYTCRTEDQTVSFKFIILSPITFMDTPPVQTAQEHQPTTIKCDVRGDPKPKILWKFNGKDMEASKYSQTPNGMKIRNVTLDDKGIYTCRAYQVSQVTSMFEEKNIRLNVQHKPMHRRPVHAKVNQAYGYKGGEVNLTCEAIAEPAANFTWFRQYKKPVPGRIIQEPHYSILQLFIQNESVFGDYMCKATNKLGALDQIITLQEGTQPPKPQKITMRATTSDTLGVEIIGPDLNQTKSSVEMFPIGFRLQYRPKESNTKWNDAAFVDFDHLNEDDTFKITGLNHNTIYEIRGATRNIAGVSDYTSTITGRTLGLQADSIMSTETSGEFSGHAGMTTTCQSLASISITIFHALVLLVT